MPRKILILGGARSGKSRYAQEIGLTLPQPVLFVATAEAGDDEMKQRIEEHRRSRPAAWHTLEATSHIGRQIQQKAGEAQTIIIDCITLLIANVFGIHGHADNGPVDPARTEREVLAEISGLTGCMDRVAANFVIVSNEIGLGLVPASSMSRLYRDLLGKANQVLAQHCDEVYVMVAGLPFAIKETPQ